jgi:hypothetical protein
MNLYEYVLSADPLTSQLLLVFRKLYSPYRLEHGVSQIQVKNVSVWTKRLGDRKTKYTYGWVDK